MGKDAALDSRARLSVHQRNKVALQPQLLGAEIWVSGGHTCPPPELAVPPGRSSPRGCQPRGCQSSASGCNKGGDLVLVGIFPCRAANSVTGGEVSLPPCAAACPRRPQLVPGEGGSRPVAHPLAPAEQLPPRCLAQTGRWDPSPPLRALSAGEGMLAGGEAPVEAQPRPRCSSVTQSPSLAWRWLYIARRDACAGNLSAVGRGGCGRLGPPPLLPGCRRARWENGYRGTRLPGLGCPNSPLSVRP